MPTRLTVSRPADFVEFRKESILQGIHGRIEEQVRLYPSGIAIKTPAVSHTYSAMNGFANSIAGELLSTCGRGLAQAAILQPNTPELIISLLASLKAHKAYVPLDPKFPKQRLRAMFEDAEPVVLLTDDEHMAVAEELAAGRVRIVNTSQIQRYSDAPNPQVPCDPLDRAYILYTSGTTGQPKGISFLHRNLLHHMMCVTNELFFSPSDRVTWLHSPTFGSSVIDIYGCLMNGGTLFPWDVKAEGFNGLAEWLVQEKVTTLQWIPAAFRQFMRTISNGLVFQDIRILVMAGEPLTAREVELFRQHFPLGSHLVNQVGTAESYNYCLYKVDHEIAIESANVAGGYAVSEDRGVLILDDAHNELPPGSIGEIGIKSDYMSAGYWRDEVLTRSKFIGNGTGQSPVYLTGDLGMLEPDGCLIHLGRKDFQVKIRGCRVELAEIDHVMTGAPGIAISAAWVVRNRLGIDELLGYVVLKEGYHFNQKEVERYLESRLPDYMVPRCFIVLDCLPTLPTGKVDRKGLPNPLDGDGSVAGTSAVLAATDVEQEVESLFKELLKVEQITSSASFLETGGDSLLAAVLLHCIHERFDVEVTFQDFLEEPTPVRLASLVRTAREKVNGHLPRGKFDLGEPQTPPSYNPAPAGTTQAPMGRAANGNVSDGVGTRRQSYAARKNLVIISAGRFGREIYTWAAEAIAAGAPWSMKGFLDNRTDALNAYDYDCKILGDVDTYEIQEGDVFIGAIGDPRDKIRYYSPIVERGGCFINIIHPLANIGKNVRFGAGIVMAPFSSISSDVQVGNHVSIGTFSNAGHDTVIGDWCQISPHCGINGGATLGEGVFLGSHACIIPGVTVGAWSQIGAGSVVLGDVSSRVKVFGNPAVITGRFGET